MTGFLFSAIIKSSRERSKKKMTNHDIQEIQKLKKFKNFIKWFRTLSKEEQEHLMKIRWKGSSKETIERKKKNDNN